MKGDWVFLENNTCSDAIGPADPCDALQIANVDQQFLIDSTDIDDKQDSLTVCRIVGEWIPSVIALWNASVETQARSFRATWHMGIYTSSVNHTSGDISSLDPANTADLDSDRWLFLRTHLILEYHPIDASGGTTGMSTLWWTNQDYAPGSNSHLDIRVKRRLKEGDSLVMANRIVAEPRHATDSEPDLIQATYRASLRAYVKF